MDTHDTQSPSGPPLDSVSADWLARLTAFKAQFGHTDVTRGHCDKSLAYWVNHVRERFRKGELPAPLKRRLDALGFRFDPRGEVWEGHLSVLAEYAAENGTDRVPRGDSDHRLAVWVMHQRAKIRGGRMEHGRFVDLARVEFLVEPRKDAWVTNIEKLAQYRKETGHCDVPRRYAQDPSLAFFVNYQRARKKEGTMSAAEEAELNAMGFCWHVKDQDWKDRYDEYAAWRQRNPGKQPSKTYDRSLYDWRRRQQAYLRGDDVSPDKQAKLARVGITRFR